MMLVMQLAWILPPCVSQNSTGLSDQRSAAIALEQRGDFAGSAAAWSAVLKSSPASAEAYAHLGFLQARQEHYPEAIILYRKALELSPDMPGLRLNLGLSLFKSGQLRPAIEAFAPLLQSDLPSSAEAQRVTVLSGMAYYGLAQYTQAVPLLKKAALADPRSLELRLALVQSCLGSKQFQCALDTYHEVLALNAESAEADMLAGEALDELKDSSGAIQQFRAAIQINPQLPNAHFSLGYMLWKGQQYAEAAREFKAELVNVPESAQALTFLGDTTMHLQDSSHALPLLEKAISIDPSIEFAHLDLGVVYAEATRPQEALKEFKVAETINPEDASVHYRLGRLYQSTGEKEKAKVEFDKTRALQKHVDDSVFPSGQ